MWWWQKGHLSSRREHPVSFSLEEAALFAQEPAPPPRLRPRLRLLSSLELRMTPSAESAFRFQPWPSDAFFVFIVKGNSNGTGESGLKRKRPLPPLGLVPTPQRLSVGLFLVGLSGKLPRV